MRTAISSFFILLLSLLSCQGQENLRVSDFASSPPLPIHRLDKAIRPFISNDAPVLRDSLIKQYTYPLEILGKAILNLPSTDAPNFFEKLHTFYREPHLLKLYDDASLLIDQNEHLGKEIGMAMAWAKATFPQHTIPAIYTHVSGLGQKICVADSLLSCSIDHYMGSDYLFYQTFFTTEQKRKAEPQFIARDVLMGWIMSEFPFGGNERILLDQMIYQGALRYLTRQAYPTLSIYDLLGYTAEDKTWCLTHEKKLWDTLIMRKHLFTPDRLTTAQYMGEKKTPLLEPETPPEIGIWLGYQIVENYMNKNKVSYVTLLQTSAQDILMQSGFNP